MLTFLLMAANRMRQMGMTTSSY